MNACMKMGLNTRSIVDKNMLLPLQSSDRSYFILDVHNSGIIVISFMLY